MILTDSTLEYNTHYAAVPPSVLYRLLNLKEGRKKNKK